MADFNRDAHPDYALFNPSTRQTAIWYLNNRVYLRGAYGPTLPSGWQLVAVGDFNGDGKPDYVLYNASTRQTAIWYLITMCTLAVPMVRLLPAATCYQGLLILTVTATWIICFTTQSPVKQPSGI